VISGKKYDVFLQLCPDPARKIYEKQSLQIERVGYDLPFDSQLGM
jgi:hypothetical protein